MSESDNKLTATLKAASINVVEDTTTEGVDVVQLYNPVNCLRCKSLVSLSEKEENEWVRVTGQKLLRNMGCHYSLGNTKCPASKLRIAKHVDIDHVVDLYNEALNAGDIKRLSSIVKRIQSKDSNTAKLIMDRIKNVNAPMPETIPLVTEIDKTPIVEVEVETDIQEEPVEEPVVEDDSLETASDEEPTIQESDDFIPE